MSDTTALECNRIAFCRIYNTRVPLLPHRYTPNLQADSKRTFLWQLENLAKREEGKRQLLLSLASALVAIDIIKKIVLSFIQILVEWRFTYASILCKMPYQEGYKRS